MSQFTRPAPKPVSDRKKRTRAKEEIVAPESTPADRSRINRNFGKAIEREVAKRTGGDRVVGSGAFKAGPHDLTGDVQVRDTEGRPIVKIECKGAGNITPKGEKTFTLKKSVVDQMVKEAEDVGNVGLLYVHFKGDEYGDDYVMFKAGHFYTFMEWARIGAAIERVGLDGDAALRGIHQEATQGGRA